jgi:2-hydroxycyclohexanecarboxyl-CoA dehydrogenase
MDLNLRDRVAIVTGAGGNAMGTGICLELAREGAHVVTNDIDPSRANEVSERVRVLGVDSLPTYADVTSLSDCQKMTDKTIQKFGRIDILVTVPAWVIRKSFVECSPEEMHRMVDVTFWGVVNSVRAALNPMLSAGSGSIVCLGSDAGRVGGEGEVIYGSAKAAIMNFARGLSREIGPRGIRINVVNAGVTKVPIMVESGWLTTEKEQRLAKQYPMGRLGVPKDLVDAIVFLASDRASFITGQTLSVSGGIV